ncbi:MAG: hypothetical protein IH605_05240 [Burkholderiales bacterium]|nr:hypothetical protein [Burkholderiales bacterium]
MKYVGMWEVAFDENNVAFPGLGNCHGIVYVNDDGLFAYHLAGTRKQYEIDAFAHFVTAHPHGGAAARGLYGYCPTNRFTGGDREHKAELKLIAAALNYNGKIYGYRWDIEQLGWGTTFVDVHFKPAFMSSIEKFEDIKESATNPSPADHKSAHLNPNAPSVAVNLDDVMVYALRTGTPTFFSAKEL